MEKEKNLAGLEFANFLDKHTFLQNVVNRKLPPIKMIFHMGACSSTTETNADYLRENNFEYTKELALFCVENNVRFIYASSGATYGNGDKGYDDEELSISSLNPLNLYGESKHRFDLWAKEQNLFDQIVGLKYFNVYGPNEYHKENMQSLVRKGFLQINETGKLKLFKSYRPECGDGEQSRDFVYVRDVVAMTLHFMDHSSVSGLYNVGSGLARTWNDLAKALFTAMGRKTDIEYIDIPEPIRDQYQYYTCARMTKIREVGFDGTMTSLEEGVIDYVHKYLIPSKRLGN
tara:strand:- start:382 stop:1248 length:867 start_codon:yes stop_codon:yes gene_type:complete